MTSFLLYALLLAIICRVIFRLAPRPRLDAAPREHQIATMPLDELDTYLTEQEKTVPGIIESAAANIQWADPEQKTKTEYCFLYLHGFSASWQETAPVTSTLAKQASANVVQARLAGHGLSDNAMQASAEEWLQSARDQFEIARRLGDKVIIVATSTGAPIAVWLNTFFSQDIHANLFLSPNFRIRNKFGFLLTWPFAQHWVTYLLGKEHSWEATSAAEAECWTHRYSMLAVIEMQKVVDWAETQAYESLSTPLAMIYMQNDPTIYPPAAIGVYDRWSSKHKQLHRVTLDGDADEHVFVGEITNPKRVEWTCDKLQQFLLTLRT